MRLELAGAAVLIAALCAEASAQVRPLHTRDLTRLSEVQVGRQLESSDVIFIPVGAVEANGVLPSDRDYVSALGFAMTMAEETGGLYMPGLVHSYPGTTVVGSSTIYMSPSQGLAHLKVIARSLLRQGFRRQVWVVISHGPAALTVGALARQFFEEERVPILYVDLDQHKSKAAIAPEDRSHTVYGAHAIVGRLEDIPLEGDYGQDVFAEEAASPENRGLKKLGELGFSGSLRLGSWIPDVLAHGGSMPLASTAAEREAWGELGRKQIEAWVRTMRLNEAMDALREHDRYTQEVIVPKFRDRLPPPRDSQ